MVGSELSNKHKFVKIQALVTEIFKKMWRQLFLEFIRERSGESHDVGTEVTVDE